MTNRNLLIVFGAAFSLFFAKQTLAIDLNGTKWRGTFQCKGVNAAGIKTNFKIRDVTMSISQVGTHAVVSADFGEGDIPYDGTVYDNAQKPDTHGVLGIVHPNTSPDSSSFNELVWGKVVYNPKTGRGSFNGIGERVSANPNGFDTCKWKFKTPAQ